MRLCALRLKAPDLSRVETSVSAANVHFLRHMDRVVIAPAQAMGAALAFEHATQ
jgi:hypothetical protein